MDDDMTHEGSYPDLGWVRVTQVNATYHDSEARVGSVSRT
jgi:hypothetical protein